MPYVSTALGSSDVRLVELAGAYRAIASGILAVPHILDRVTDASGEVLFAAAGATGKVDSRGLREIQEGLRGVVRIPGGTARALDGGSFPIPVMGKTGTTNDFRDALFVGSTYGPGGVTVAVRIGFDDGRSLGAGETGGRTALPIFRDIMLRAYTEDLLGPVPQFPEEIERGIDRFLGLLPQGVDPGPSAVLVARLLRASPNRSTPIGRLLKPDPTTKIRSAT
jgi:penicillin-binding protein 1A